MMKTVFVNTIYECRNAPKTMIAMLRSVEMVDLPRKLGGGSMMIKFSVNMK